MGVADSLAEVFDAQQNQLRVSFSVDEYGEALSLQIFVRDSGHGTSAHRPSCPISTGKAVFSTSALSRPMSTVSLASSSGVAASPESVSPWSHRIALNSPAALAARIRFYRVIVGFAAGL
jgi:hypothetical protein